MLGNVGAFEITAAVVVVVACVYLVAVLLSFFLPRIMEGGQNVAQDFGNILEMNIATGSQRRRRRLIQRELDEELGHVRFWRDPEADVLRAAQNAQVISALDRRLRKAVRTCFEMHWRLVAGVQPESMSVVATHPLAQSSRARAIDLASMLADNIEQYPLLESAPELVTLALGAKRLASSCAICPYFSCSVEDAPRPCPSLVATSAERRPNNGIKDGEVLDE